VNLRSKRGVVLVCAALVLALFLVRPGATRLKTRIASSIGMALQRQVEISRVHLRLLPQPGFDLEGFVVHDDPAFGAEPVLRAQDVTAFLRLSSLFRGRLEISRLSLSEPSLNLVRRDDGRWNIETFLERTASIAVAPTSKARSESRPAFPYIEADRGRINFKSGPEKKPFAVTDAKYSVWQDSENTWGMRLRGQPVRTDFSLSDTGQLNIDGTWQRAATLHETPIQFNLQWEGGQLGQLTKLLSGEDRGWRGTVRLSVVLTGVPADLLVRGDGSLQDFHRYDITDSRPLELKSHCDAHYSVVDRSLRQILCQTPVSDGELALTGEVTNLLGPRLFELQLAADKVPLDAMLAVARRAKKNLPDDLRATGTLQAKLNARASGMPNSIAFEGGGQASNFHLQSEAAKTELVLDVVPFSLVSESEDKATRKVPARRDGGSAHEPDEPHLSFGPVFLKLGRPAPAAVQGWIARAGYSISVKGESELQRLLEVARVSGIPTPHPAATGSAKVDLRIAGPWQGFTSPVTTGTVELRSVRAEIHGLNGPLDIGSARLNLGESATRVEAISASIAGTQWTGTLSFPRPCPSASSCVLTFDLHADEISTDQLNDWLNPNPPRRPWYRFSSPASPGGHSILAAIRASGALAINRAVIRNLVATRVAAKLVLDQGKLRLSDLQADVLGGKHRGEWRADFTAKPPAYSGSGGLDGISLAQLAEAMHDNWITGAANGRYQIELTGFSAAELIASAKGSLQFDMRDGTFPHMVLTTAPLRVRRFTGLLAVRQGEVDLQEATLESPAASYAVTGKASMSRKLDFKLVPEGSPGLAVTGTLSDPRVAPAHRPETQAALKR
jgi:hypothetical protein